MAFQEQWDTLSARIRGLMSAAELYARFLRVNTADPYGMTAGLRDQSMQVLSALAEFREDFEPAIPSPALARIDDFVRRNQTLLEDLSGGPGAKDGRARTVLLALGAFETEMSFLLSDTQQRIRSISERAFSHLQRQIVADPDFRGKWQGAFERGETACEKLGAVHLLLHGIWAFKAHAEGERTDLVFQEPLSHADDIATYVDGLVLTEWKKAAPRDNAVAKFEEARGQARDYAAGSLAGIELTGYRYAVVVSPQNVAPPADILEGGVAWRHINIAVDPESPSRRR